MPTYEKLRKNMKDAEMFSRLENYFRAIDEEKTDQYHKERGR